MPDTGNTTFWNYFATSLATLSGAWMVTAKLKGAQDTKIKNVDEKVEEVKKSIDENKKEMKEEFDAQGERINNRVHVNELVAHKELIETKFKFICDSLTEIKDNSNKRRSGDNT